MSVDPGNYPIKFYRGSQWSKRFTFVGMNLTGYTGALTLRYKVGGPSVLALMGSPGLVITPGVNSTIDVLITSAQIDALTQTYGDWDLDLTIGGILNRYLAGRWSLFEKGTAS